MSSSRKRAVRPDNCQSHCQLAGGVESLGMVLRRDLERSLKGRARRFPVLVVTGPRQSGKTTLCRAASRSLPASRWSYSSGDRGERAGLLWQGSLNAWGPHPPRFRPLRGARLCAGMSLGARRKQKVLDGDATYSIGHEGRLADHGQFGRGKGAREPREFDG